MSVINRVSHGSGNLDVAIVGEIERYYRCCCVFFVVFEIN